MGSWCMARVSIDVTIVKFGVLHETLQGHMPVSHRELQLWHAMQHVDCPSSIIFLRARMSVYFIKRGERVQLQQMANEHNSHSTTEAAGTTNPKKRRKNKLAFLL
jgi:hypothetical protein